MSADAGTGTSFVWSVAPMLSVRGGARAVEFYKAAFGAIEVYRVEDPGGSVVSRLWVEGAEFWLADESPEHGNFSPDSLGGGTARMILTVPDPDGMFARALAAGAREVFAVNEEYGWRLGRVVDPFGHHWEIGRPLGGGFVPRPIRPRRNLRDDNFLGSDPASTKVKPRPVDPSAHALFASAIRMLLPEQR